MMCIVVLLLLDKGLRQLYQVQCECAQSSVQKTSRCHWQVLFYHLHLMSERENYDKKRKGSKSGQVAEGECRIEVP